MNLSHYLTPYDHAITALMSRGKLNMRWRVEPEQRLSIELADRLRELTAKGVYRGVWTHVANEGKRSRIVAQIMKAMGMLSGAPDFIFVWDGGAGCIELKVPPNKQSDNQKHFEQWCIGNNIPYAVCVTVDQAMEVLRQWQAIR